MTPEERKAARIEGMERKKREAEAKAAEAAPDAEPAPIVMPKLVLEGEVPPPAFEDPDEGIFEEDEPQDEFERFLAAQDDETRELLTDAELRVIYEQETARAAKERKEAARKGALARAQRHARVVAGLVGPEALEAQARLDRLNRKVTWTINMPEAGNTGMLIDEGMRIDGRLMRHGETVTGTMAQYESYRSIEWNAHQGELDFQGKGKLSRLRQTASGINNMRGVA